MTGYYPHEQMRYGKFLNQKRDNTFTNMETIKRDFSPKQQD